MAWYHPLLFTLDAERAHALTIAMLEAWGKAGTPLAPTTNSAQAVTVAGIRFPNPVGLAAGVDKDARAIRGFLGLGFGFVEVGTLTPKPQPGNPKPRIFRLPEDRGVVNRLGFNNGGIDAALARVAALTPRPGVIGINVGANKDSTDRIADYATAVAKAAPLADYVTINISSPNTPGLRDLQSQPELGNLIAASDAARHVGGKRVPLFLKIAPDLDRAGLEVAARAAIDGGIDVLIVSNTTISRPPTLRSAKAGETGGLSGAPLAPLARAKLAEAIAITGGAIPVISAGGIGSAAEARARLDAGASLIQLYSALVYEGPGLARRIVAGL
ncbi:dihydroorotate dehydrogenase (quinone) [Sphingomonas sp. Leaf407]|uniref:quinone-dependent dihydroorotate dehydrogenase n=1 Tax=unclassified Sphingomonas TaxID=196159 RepID=UPI0006F8E505|nr:MULTISPECIES: quinone-dependent dihydroorotate dehydrogenase [unclassified Sphingomonas]KQN37458.1 dihydroorotate dehydrogenase (quinone) [Sphingomonas sp. Leaf42]KQT27826.1 dihydroorotate dehydrogenase (quinone) [Sphingomonas sp. Leaf407]